MLEDGADARFFDPHVTTARIGATVQERQPDLFDAVDASDVVVLLQAHKAFDLEAIVARGKQVFDTRGILAPAGNVERL